MAVLTVDLSPSHIPVNTSVTDYQPVTLTLSVYNGDTTPADVSGGLSVVLSVDPGGTGSDANLLLSGLSDPQGSGQPMPLANPIANPGTWHLSQPSTVPVEFVLRPQVAAQNFIQPGQTLTFTFSNVVVDLVPGEAGVPVTVQPSVLPNGTAATISSPPEIWKVPAPLASPTLKATAEVLAPPSSATTLTWVTPGAASCTLSWSPASNASVSYYDSTQQQQVPAPNPWQNAPLQASAATAVTATLLGTTSFMLTSVGGGSGGQTNASANLEVTVTTPTFDRVFVPPLVSGVSPPSGDPAGGQQVTITGARLTQASDVIFTPVGAPAGTRGTKATNVTSVPGAEDTQVTATTPAGTGIAHVTVTTPVGTSPAVPADVYAYTSAAALPTVTGVSPAYGDVAGGQLVTVTGAGFADPATVTFTPAGAGGAAGETATGVTVVSATELTATTPAGGTGPADVTVTTASGTSPVTPADGYTYVSQGLPSVTGVALPDGDSSAGDPAGGQQAVITGTGLSVATGVVFTPVAGTAGAVGVAIGISNVTGAEDTQVTVTTPAGAGVVDVIVTAAGGTSLAVPADQFSYGIQAVVVPPYQPFQLIWSCYTGWAPRLSWQFTGDTSVIAESVTVTDETGTVNSGDTVSDTGRAVATINGPATFQLTVPPRAPAPPSFLVGIAALKFTGLTASGPVLNSDPGAGPLGQQTVTLSWYAANVILFTLEQNGTVLPSPPSRDDRTCTVSLPLVTQPTGPVTFTYTLTAYGYVDNTWTSIPHHVTVNPLTVALLNPSLSGPAVTDSNGTQTVTLAFQAQNATGISIAGPDPRVVQTLSPTATGLPLNLPVPTLPGPLQYTVTVTANGYIAPGTSYSASYRFNPLAVQLTSFGPVPAKSPFPRTPVTLTWTADYPTGFTLTGEPNPPASARNATVSPSVTKMYTLTAQGYPPGPALPSKTLWVTVAKEDSDKLLPIVEKLRPKEDNPQIPGAALPADDESELSGPDPAEPAGGQPGQQPFIGQDERPDVGSHLRSGGPGAAPPDQA